MSLKVLCDTFTHVTCATSTVTKPARIWRYWWSSKIKSWKFYILTCSRFTYIENLYIYSTHNWWFKMAYTYCINACKILSQYKSPLNFWHLYLRVNIKANFIILFVYPLVYHVSIHLVWQFSCIWQQTGSLRQKTFMNQLPFMKV